MHPSSAAEHRTRKVNNKNILDDVNLKIVITKGIKREVLRYGSKYHILPSAILAMFICCDIHVGHLFKQVRPVSVCSRSFRMLRSRTDNALAFAGFHGLHTIAHYQCSNATSISPSQQIHLRTKKSTHGRDRGNRKSACSNPSNP